ncbi:hypothetical protein FBU31_000472 [Coemansia sp. 'formosensis']|nr:hypothetical protein FBU31_000472 [Coemansia sp. 'formosensis']
MTMALNLEFRLLRSTAEVQAAHHLESLSYSSDEGASLKNMLYRYEQAPHLFLGAFHGQTLVGYIMGTQAGAALVTHESMGRHDPRGSTVCVHSVCVDPRWRRRGVASMLLKKYTEMVRCRGGVKRLAMMSRVGLVPLYERNGYQCVGPSSVIHGKFKTT